MTEHEAGKSMVVLSVYAVLVSVVKSIWQIRANVPAFFDRYVVMVPTNFLISLVFVECAVTLSVIAVSPKGVPGIWWGLLCLGGKNLLLASTLLCALILLNSGRSIIGRTWARLSIAGMFTTLYFVVLRA